MFIREINLFLFIPNIFFTAYLQNEKFYFINYHLLNILSLIEFLLVVYQ